LTGAAEEGRVPPPPKLPDDGVFVSDATENGELTPLHGAAFELKTAVLSELEFGRVTSCDDAGDWQVTVRLTMGEADRE
jgi:hypothetical protein